MAPLTEGKGGLMTGAAGGIGRGVAPEFAHEPAVPPHNARRLAAERYIDQHLHDCTLTPSRVAGHLNISVRQVGRLFEPTGSSPARFIHERRLLKAREQLTLPQYRQVKIADLAYLWGFSSHAHFARAFRDYFGMTPSEARAMSQTKNRMSEI